MNDTPSTSSTSKAEAVVRRIMAAAFAAAAAFTLVLYIDPVLFVGCWLLGVFVWLLATTKIVRYVFLLLISGLLQIEGLLAAHETVTKRDRVYWTFLITWPIAIPAWFGSLLAHEIWETLFPPPPPKT